jgi:ParB-like nuclease domain
MQVNLKSLRPNPFRDFVVDPIDSDAVSKITDSINEDGFWGGVVARKNKSGELEIAAGHHRIEAAKQCGITVADIFVGQIDDEAMIRIYARENSTQRGNGSTAVAGTVASAIRYLARQSLTFGREIASEKRGAKVGDQGIGEPAISDFFKGQSGIGKSVVRQQLKNLKESGDYDRIIGEVIADVEAQQAAELKRLEEQHAPAEQIEEAQATVAKTKTKATKVASKKKEDKTFDFEGVAKHLKKDAHVIAFRDVVTGPAVREFLLVENQAALAEQLVGAAKDAGVELTGFFIKDRVMSSIYGVQQVAKSAKKKLESTDLIEKAKARQREFSRAAGTIFKKGGEISDMLVKWPKDGPLFPVSDEFKQSMTKLANTVELLKRYGLL